MVSVFVIYIVYVNGDLWFVGGVYEVIFGGVFGFEVFDDFFYIFVVFFLVFFFGFLCRLLFVELCYGVEVFGDREYY